FADTITPSMVKETRFFLDTIFVTGGTVHDLMTANFTALDHTLSTFYGYGNVQPSDGAESEGFVQVERPAEYGMGILAQGSLLASTAHQAYTSPTQRGLMVTEHFLCMEPPPVPAVVPALSDTTAGTGAVTTREKYEVAHAAPGTGCGNCH